MVTLTRKVVEQAKFRILRAEQARNSARRLRRQYAKVIIKAVEVEPDLDPVRWASRYKT